MTDLKFFVPALVVLLATPGPTNTLLWAAGGAVGIRRSLILLAGELAGYFTAITIITLILGPIIVLVPTLGTILSLAAATYICYLAVKLWRRPDHSNSDAAIITTKKVFLVTLLNPKAFVFVSTILPGGDVSLVWHYLILAGCIVAIGFSWIAFGHIVGASSGPRKVVTLYRISSVALVIFAGWIAVSALTPN